VLVVGDDHLDLLAADLAAELLDGDAGRRPSVTATIAIVR